MHTHIASGLAEKQMAELKNETREYKQASDIIIEKQATDIASIKLILEQSVLGTRCHDDNLPTVVDASTSVNINNRCSVKSCCTNTERNVSMKWKKQCDVHLAKYRKIK
jgi:hypothetical protein